jgi:hypothetical protein
MAAGKNRDRMEGALTPTPQQKGTNIGDIFVTYRYYLFYIVLFILCIFWIKKPLTEYLVGDASKFVLLIYSILGLTKTHLIDLPSGRDIWHPFLYQSILILTGKIFGVYLYKLRLIGVVCLIIDLYMLRKIANLMVDNQRDGRLLTFLSCLFFLMIPLTIDGALHIDIDNTIMLPLLLIFFYLFIRQEQTDDKRVRYRILSILMCFIMPLLLWSKLTTPLALPLTIGIFYILKNKPMSAVVFPISLVGIGGSIFALTWFFFCSYFNLPFLSIFERIMHVFFKGVNDSVNAEHFEFLRELTMIIFWNNIIISILLVVCLVLIIRQIIRKEKVEDPILFATIFTIIIGGTYLFVGGISYGIPKYHYPLTAFAALIISYFFRPYVDTLSVINAIYLLLGTMILSLFYFYVDDPIYLLTRGLKMRALSDLPYDPILYQIGTVSFVYLLPIFVSILLLAKSKRQYAIGLIFITVIAQMVGFNFKRSLAEYHTSHGYGYYGASDTYNKLLPMKSVLFSEGLIIAPFELLPTYALDETNMNFDQFKSHILEASPDAVVFGAPLNTVTQMKSFYLKADFNQFMEENYKLNRAGDYYLYLKK